MLPFLGESSRAGYRECEQDEDEAQDYPSYRDSPDAEGNSRNHDQGDPARYNRGSGARYGGQRPRHRPPGDRINGRPDPVPYIAPNMS